MRKSLGDKRKQLTPAAIEQIAQLFGDAIEMAGSDARVKVMRNQDFGFARLTVERPLRPVWRLDDDTVAKLPDDVAAVVAPRHGTTWPSEQEARPALAHVGLEAKQITAIIKTIKVRDDEAPSAKAKKPGPWSEYEPDPDLRDAENIPLPDGYLTMSGAEQVEAVRAASEKHLTDEIHPYVPDAWIDHTKTKIGYEIPFTRQFYVYAPPRPVAEIRAEIDALEQQIQQWMKGLAR